MVGSAKERRLILGILLALATGFTSAAVAQKHGIDEMSLERWAKMREVERHQMQIAEKYYREKSWKVAAAEYDKYLTLYESSDAASHALLKWSLCHVQLRKQNTSIDDGFRSVVDYWPDSEDAVAAGYYIGKTYKDIGQTKKAKTALKQVIEKHAKKIPGVYAMVALAEIAEIEKDDKTKVEMWKALTFDAARTKRTQTHCIGASIRLATYLFAEGDFDAAVSALATTYDEKQIAQQVVQRSEAPLRGLLANSETTTKGDRLADKAIAYLKGLVPGTADGDEAKATAKSLYYLVADVTRHAGRNDKILAVYGQIAKLYGTDDTLLDRTAAWYRSQDQFDKARDAYRRFEDQIVGLTRVAQSYRDEKEVDQAVATYAKLSAEDAENAAKWKGESAATYRQFSKYEQAIAIYQDLMSSDVENADRWLWETASCYRDWGKNKEAIGYFRQSNRFPDNYREMARCHRRLKQGKEAVILYTQIAGGHKPSAPWAMTQIGYTEEESGNKDKAIAAFKRVCKLFPKDRYASQSHAHLQNKYKLSVTLGGAKDD